MFVLFLVYIAAHHGRIMNKKWVDDASREIALEDGSVPV